MRYEPDSHSAHPEPATSDDFADPSLRNPAESELEQPHHAAPLLTRLALRYFIRLRWLFVLIATALLLIEARFIGSHRPAGLWLTIGFLAALNLLWRVILGYTLSPPDDLVLGRRFAARLRWHANAQIGFDLLALTLLLRYSGGAENPFAIFYVFHMAIGSLLLPPLQAAAHGALAIALYSGLVLGETGGWIGPHYTFLAQVVSPRQPMDWARAAGMICAVASGVIGSLYLTSHSAQALRLREHRLSAVNEDLERSQLAIADLQRRRSLFMQTAAHQLKSPLAGVQTLAQLIRDEIVVGSEIFETCDLIKRRCQDGIYQVSKLLTLARVQDADPKTRASVPADLCAVVRAQCEAHAPIAEAHHLTLDCEGAAYAPIFVPVHHDDLADCLGNLIDNAIKYTRENGHVRVVVVPNCHPEREPPADFVSTAAWRKPRRPYAAVRVIDTGIGIDPALLQSPGGHGLFDAFRRGRNAVQAKIPGTGLGLSIVREVVEQAGGQIQVRSIPGSGTQFTIVLPTVAAVLVGRSDESPRARQPSSAPPATEMAVAGSPQEPPHA